MYYNKLIENIFKNPKVSDFFEKGWEKLTSVHKGRDDS